MNHMQKTKELLSRSIKNEQYDLNQATSQYHIHTHQKQRNRNFKHEYKARSKELAAIQRSQIQLKNLTNRTEQQKDRLLSENQVKNYDKKFRFGFENIEVSSNVLDRYKEENYLSQSMMLEKFRKEAEQIKKRKKRKRHEEHHKQNKDEEKFHETEKFEIKKRRNHKKFKQQIREFDKIEREQRKYILYQRQRMNNISFLMRDLSKSIQKNTKTLEQSFNELRDHFREKKKKKLILPKVYHKTQIIIEEPEITMKKVPLIKYKNHSVVLAKLSNPHFQSHDFSYSEVKQQSKDISKILQANNRRLNNLIEYSGSPNQRKLPPIISRKNKEF